MSISPEVKRALLISVVVGIPFGLIHESGTVPYETAVGGSASHVSCRIDGDLGVKTKRSGCVSMLEVKERMIEDERQAINSSHVMEDPDSDREALQKLNSKMEISFSMDAAEYVAKWFEKKGYMSCGLLSCEPTSKYWIEVYQGLPNQSYGGESQ